MAQKVWDEVVTPITSREQSQSVEGPETTAVIVKDGYIYVTTSQTITVEIFSILGQLISRKELKPGTYRTRIAARGIYILKIGSLTKRIAI